jgi:hypothetical protein
VRPAVVDALHRRGTVTEAMQNAFDLLELDGEDLRHIPLLDRKRRLARLLSGRRLGIVLSDHTDDGPRGYCLEAAGGALPVGPLAGLAKGQEPGQPGDDPGA